MRADKKERRGRAELTTETKATRRQGGRENGGKGAGDQSLKGGERRKYRGGGVGGTNYWVEDRLKDVLYNTGKTANIL